MSGGLRMPWTALRAWRDGGRYPLDRSDERLFPRGFRGPVLIFDIDGTYLATELDRVLAMARIPLDFPIDKRNVPGTAALLRELRHGPGDETRLTPLYFVSASPPLLRGVIRRKMLADGVEPDGITFKRWSSLLLRGRFRQLREQIAFKLSALLVHRGAHPAFGEEWLFGDDREDDPLIYALYSDVAAGRLRGEALSSVLGQLEVAPADARQVVALAQSLPALDPVRRVYIHLVTGRPASRLAPFSPLIVATRNSVQAALSLAGAGMVRRGAVTAVARDLARDLARNDTPIAAGSPFRLDETIADAMRRGLCSADHARDVVQELRAAGLWARDLDSALDFSSPRCESPPAPRAPGVAHVDDAVLRWCRKKTCR